MRARFAGPSSSSWPAARAATPISALITGWAVSGLVTERLTESAAMPISNSKKGQYFLLDFDRAAKAATSTLRSSPRRTPSRIDSGLSAEETKRAAKAAFAGGQTGRLRICVQWAPWREGGRLPVGPNNHAGRDESVSPAL
jgi:hypothetical protein